MRNKYHVGFYFYTDLRADRTVEASSELAALTLALEDLGPAVSDWCGHGRGFKITIEHVW